MPFTLTSHGEMLGRTGAELSGLAVNTRGWHFLPTPAFERVRPLLLELQQATSNLQELLPGEETLASIREEERDAFARNALMGDPTAPRFLELMDEMEQLGMTLHDESGATVPTRTIGVTELELDPKSFRELLQSIDPGSDPALSAVPPFYLLVAGF